MSKLLNVDDMLEAARDAKLPTYNLRRRQIEAVAQFLGDDLAEFLDIAIAGKAEWQSGDFVGLFVSFGPKFKSQPCPSVIDENDPEGEWEDDHEGLPGAPLCLNRKKRRPFMVWFRELFLSKEVRQS